MNNQNFTLLPETSVSSTLTARRNEIKTQVKVYTISANYTFPNHSRGYGHLGMIYDIETGLTSWEFDLLPFYQNDPFKLNRHLVNNTDINFALGVNQKKINREFSLFSSFYIQNNTKLIWFTCNGEFVGYADFTECYPSLEQAKDAIFQLLPELIESYSPSKRFENFPKVCLREYLHATYAKKPVFRKRLDGTKKRTGTKIVEVYIIDVERENDHWKLVLEDEVKRQTYVHLSDDYQLLDVTGYVGHNYPEIGEFKDNKTLQEHLNKLYS